MAQEVSSAPMNLFQNSLKLHALIVVKMDNGWDPNNCTLGRLLIRDNLFFFCQKKGGFKTRFLKTGC